MIRIARTALLLAALAFATAPKVPGSDDAPAPGTPSAPEASSIPDEATLEAEGAVIGEITYRIGDIFDLSDPKENNAVFRLANALHPKTRRTVIQRLLLFESGDPYLARVVHESERILRSQRYFFEARIVPVRYENGKVDLEVRTRDVWTLNLGLGFGRAGGQNTYRIGIEDANFLGFGKDLTIRRISDVDRTTDLYRYRDPNVGGTRSVLQLVYANASDGGTKELLFQRPFYALDARWAASLDGLTDRRTISMYDRGEVFSEYRDDSDVVEVWGGRSTGLGARRALRWLGGATYEAHDFSRLPGAEREPLPSDRKLVYPWVGISVVTDAYTEATDVDQIVKIEDLNFGATWDLRAGLSMPAWGGDRPRAPFRGGWRTGIRPARRQMLFLSASVAGRYEKEGFQDTLASGRGQWYRRDVGENLLFVGLSADVAYRLDYDHQLLLGGDNGLRGYPLRYAWGDRRFLLTVEQRFYTRRHVLRLFRVGAALFFDMGRCWFAGGAPDDPGLLRDVGGGLRLALSRTSRGAMMHLDVAYAIDAVPGIARFQFLVVAKDSF